MITRLLFPSPSSSRSEVSPQHVNSAWNNEASAETRSRLWFSPLSVTSRVKNYTIVEVLNPYLFPVLEPTDRTSGLLIDFVIVVCMHASASAGTHQKKVRPRGSPKILISKHRRRHVGQCFDEEDKEEARAPSCPSPRQSERERVGVQRLLVCD